MSRATFSGNLVDNLWYNNPIFVQILGICSTLAVTNNLTNTAIMTVAVTGVTAMSNLVISLIRDFIPRKVRMIVQTVVIAFWVIVVDILLRAYFFEVSKTLGPYVGLIITNSSGSSWVSVPSLG
jgi:Na+-transporting NADH:ubiquinone oxidoreductase subunit D